MSIRDIRLRRPQEPGEIVFEIHIGQPSLVMHVSVHVIRDRTAQPAMPLRQQATLRPLLARNRQCLWFRFIHGGFQPGEIPFRKSLEFQWDLLSEIREIEVSVELSLPQGVRSVISIHFTWILSRRSSQLCNLSGLCCCCPYKCLNQYQFQSLFLCLLFCLLDLLLLLFLLFHWGL